MKGKIVILNLTDDQRKALGGNHTTSPASESTAPAIIVESWSESTANLKVFGDSENNIWVTSAPKGDKPGEWKFAE